MAQPTVTFTLLDISGQKSTTTIYLSDITAANFDAVVGAGGLVEDLLTMMQTITACNVIGYKVSLDNVKLNPIGTPNEFAYREYKGVFRYIDDVTAEIYSFEVAGPDALVVGPPNNSEEFDINTNIALSTIVKPLFDASAVSRVGNAVVLTSGYKAGRNI